MTSTLLTIHEVAHLVGCKYYQLAYLHDTGVLPEPPRFGGRRVYTEELLEIVRDYFKQRTEREEFHEHDE